MHRYMHIYILYRCIYLRSAGGGGGGREEEEKRRTRERKIRMMNKKEENKNRPPWRERECMSSCHSGVHND